MLLTILAFLLANLNAVPADTIDVKAEHYRIYRSDGTPATMDDIRAAIKKVDVVFVGEQHDDPVSHFIEQRVLEAMYDTYGNAAALSLEMFSRDVQYIVDEYLAGLITDAHFQLSSSPWSNYPQDYKPLVDFAKDKNLAVIAANAPRRYANRVTRNGRQSLLDLSDQALTYLAPLPYGAASAKYTEQWNKVMSDAMASMRPATPAVTPVAPPVAPEPAVPAEKAAMVHKMGEGMEMKHEEGAGHEMAEGHEMGSEHKMAEGMKMDPEAHAKMHAEHMASGKEAQHEMGEGHKMGEMKHEEGAGHEMGSEHKMGEGMAMKHEAKTSDTPPPPPPPAQQHGGDTMLDAQTLWDATMAWSIAEHLARKPGSKVVHMVGGFHSETGTGTPEHLVQYRPGTRFMVITMKTTDDITHFNKETHFGMGDFVILGDETLPRTYGTRTR